MDKKKLKIEPIIKYFEKNEYDLLIKSTKKIIKVFRKQDYKKI